MALATVSSSRTTSSYPVCFSAVARLLVNDANDTSCASCPTVLRRRGEGESELKRRGVGVWTCECEKGESAERRKKGRMGRLPAASICFGESEEGGGRWGSWWGRWHSSVHADLEGDIRDTLRRWRSNQVEGEVFRQLNRYLSVVRVFVFSLMMMAGLC